MGELQKKDDDLPVKRDDYRLAKWAMWAVLVLVGGVLLFFLGPWLLTLAIVGGGLYAAYRLWDWWKSLPQEDEPPKQLPDPLKDEDDLGSSIELEDLRNRMEEEVGTKDG